MKKLKSINDFIYSTQVETLGAGYAPCEIEFKAFNISERQKCLPELFIDISLANEQSVSLAIIGNDMDIQRVAFNSFYFTNDELVNFSNIFDFEVIQNRLHKERLQGTLSFVHPDYGTAKPIIKQHDGGYYLLVYASRRSFPARCMSEDFFGDDI